MLTNDVRPKTLSGVKRLASQIRKERGIKHARALDIAAQAASCENFRNAKKNLPYKVNSRTGHHVFLTRYWSNKDQKFARGRETIRVELSIALLKLCSKVSLKYVRGFGDQRMVMNDHFVCDTIDPSQEYARRRLCMAERSIRFMEHTGLQPARLTSTSYPNELNRDPLPDIDHSTDWVDPVSGQFVLVDEPYGNAPNEKLRAEWAERNKWNLVKTTWPGMYSPYDCDLYIAAEKEGGYNFDALVDKINAIPKPVTLSTWHGVSVRSRETFLSPNCQTKQDERRARCKGTIYPAASSKTLPYSFNVGDRLRRPKGELGKKNHVEAGRVIKAAMSSGLLTYRAWSQLNSLRATLEDWMALETDKKWRNDREFFDVYYGEPKANEIGTLGFGISRSKTLSDLKELRRKLKRCYPDCAPLRQQVSRVETSINLLTEKKTSD